MNKSLHHHSVREQISVNSGDPFPNCAVREKTKKLIPEMSLRSVIEDQIRKFRIF